VNHRWRWNLSFSLLKKSQIKCLQLSTYVFSVIFSSLCQLDPFLIIPQHFAKKKGIQKVDGNFQIFQLALRSGCKAVTGFLLKFIRRWRIPFAGWNRTETSASLFKPGSFHRNGRKLRSFPIIEIAKWFLNFWYGASCQGKIKLVSILFCYSN
jgi:hypothetical protein